MATILTPPQIRYCSITVDHPFDPVFAPTQSQSGWAKLVNSDEEEYALLLCPHSAQEWLVWLPSQGETILSVDELCSFR
ncbi:MAG: hypothetical protein ACK58N_01155 [Synechocystis sp.]